MHCHGKTKCAGCPRHDAPGVPRDGDRSWPAIGFVGSKVIPIYWDYLSMQDPVKEAAMAATRTGRKRPRRGRNSSRAPRAWAWTSTEDAVEFGQQGDRIVVRVAWEVPLDLVRLPPHPAVPDRDNGRSRRDALRREPSAILAPSILIIAGPTGVGKSRLGTGRRDARAGRDRRGRLHAGVPRDRHRDRQTVPGGPTRRAASSAGCL